VLSVEKCRRSFEAEAKQVYERPFSKSHKKSVSQTQHSALSTRHF